MQSIQSSATKLVFLAKKDSHHEMNRTKLIANHRLDKQKTQTNTLYQAVQANATKQVNHAKTHTSTLLDSHRNIKDKLNHLKNHCRHLQSLIMIQHPARTLNKGYALIHQEGRIVSSSTKIDTNQDLQVEFHDGKISATPHSFK
ncbi:exodeoxyribonuclease VII large subunit [Moraxella bovoculi]|nr:exodeoxyribonuclease VII large subunit [Moraxella bovoculi]